MTAEDAWGNVSETNITVAKSAMEITIHPPQGEQLHEPTVTVFGTVGMTGHTVWVNGVKATDNGDGTWTAEQVPLPSGGTAVIQARAIPNTDNGGNGSGGGGGGSATYENPGNPASAHAQDAEAQSDKPEGVYVDTDFIAVGASTLTFWSNVFDWYEEFEQGGYGHAWSAKGGGAGGRGRTADITFPSGSSHCEGRTVYTWPPSLLQWGFQVTTVTGTGDCDEDFTPGAGPTPPPGICPQYSKIDTYVDYVWDNEWEIETLHWEFHKRAQTTLRLRTGGKAVPGRKNLWVLTGSAAAVLNEWEAWPCRPNVPMDPIASQRIVLGELGRLGSDGRLYTALPDGVEKDVTPKVSGLDNYIFDAYGALVQPSLALISVDASNPTSTLVTYRLETNGVVAKGIVAPATFTAPGVVQSRLVAETFSFTYNQRDLSKYDPNLIRMEVNTRPMPLISECPVSVARGTAFATEIAFVRVPVEDVGLVLVPIDHQIFEEYWCISYCAPFIGKTIWVGNSKVNISTTPSGSIPTEILRGMWVEKHWYTDDDGNHLLQTMTLFIHSVINKYACQATAHNFLSGSFGCFQYWN